MVSAMVGPLAGLEVLGRASSNGFQASSGSCRHDTSACVCTSIAISSSDVHRCALLAAARASHCAMLSPRSTSSTSSGAGCQCIGPKMSWYLRMPVEQRRQTDGVGIEHRAAAIAREAIARRPDHIDVGRAQRDALLQNAEALVEQRIQAALDDLLLACARAAAPAARGRARRRISIASGSSMRARLPGS